MPEFLLRDVLEWTSGIPAGLRTADPDLVLRGVCTDSRHVSDGCLFLALHGQKHDGHQFLKEAAASGAAAFLIDDLSALDNLAAEPARSGFLPTAILTGDTLRALQNLAAGYRRTLPGKVVGITGSVGKTSTRQIVSACLETKLQVHQTSGNLNNEIGLPQTLLQAQASHQAIVLEMGMRGPGEISLLSRIAEPDMVMITAIGTSHIGRLGSQEAILAAKAEILDGLLPGGLVILNADDPYLLRLAGSITGKYRLVFVASAGQRVDPAGQALIQQAECLIESDGVRTLSGQTSFVARLMQNSRKTREVKVLLPFPGEHHVMNTLFGLAAARELGVDLKTAAAGAASCRFAGNRQRILQAGSVTIMDDSYNASPESMLAALKSLSALAGSGRRMGAALGGMLELGDFAPAAHREMGAQAARFGLARLFVMGPLGEDVVSGAHSVNPHLEVSLHAGHDEMADRLLSWLEPGDCLLVKGSRAFAMEKITESVLRGLGQDQNNRADGQAGEGH